MNKVKTIISNVADTLRAVQKKVSYVFKITQWVINSLASVADILDKFPVSDSVKNPEEVGGEDRAGSDERSGGPEQGNEESISE